MRYEKHRTSQKSAGSETRDGLWPHDILFGKECSLCDAGTRGHLGVAAPFSTGKQDQLILCDHKDTHEEIIMPGANEYRMMTDHFADAVLNGKPLSYHLGNSLG